MVICPRWPLTGDGDDTHRGTRKLKVELSWCSDDETIAAESIKACPTPVAAKAKSRPNTAKAAKAPKERVLMLWRWSAFNCQRVKESKQFDQ